MNRNGIKTLRNMSSNFWYFRTKQGGTNIKLLFFSMFKFMLFKYYNSNVLVKTVIYKVFHFISKRNSLLSQFSIFPQGRITFPHFSCICIKDLPTFFTLPYFTVIWLASSKNTFVIRLPEIFHPYSRGEGKSSSWRNVKKCVWA